MHRNSRVEQVTETIQRNLDLVYRLAFSMVKMQQDAEDIRQEVFIRYIRTNPQFESPEHERAWFIRVTTNLCKNLWKSAWRQKMVSMDMFEETADVDRSVMTANSKLFANASVSGMGNVDSLPLQISLNEEEEAVVETVKRLPIKYRLVIHLFYYEEMSIEEIAKALNLQPSNVRARLTRARKMLKNWLKEDV